MAMCYLRTSDIEVHSVHIGKSMNEFALARVSTDLGVYVRIGVFV